MLPDGLPFREVWAVDFEFIGADGEHPVPACMVALELRSGRLLRYWQDELRRMRSPPIPMDSSALYVAYAAPAEFSCHLVLGWPLPERVLDLYVEFCRLTNGRTHPLGTALLAALAAYGLDGMQSDEKKAMRELILSGGPWDAAERTAILDYCESDVRALKRLLPKMVGDMFRTPGDLERALLRGRYMCAVARMERRGVPIDVGTLARLRDGWEAIQDRLIAAVDSEYQVYDGRTFKADRFAAYLIRERIPWPRLDSGALALDGDTFRDMAKAHPQITALRELRHSLGELRLNDLAVGQDGRNRVALMPFRSRTGRNQPSNSRFIFGPSTWLRGLIKPEPGRAVSYVDWAAQEVGIAAALSRDVRYQTAYKSGDPYLSFAKEVGLAPAHAIRQSHKVVRDQMKALVLGANYGMGPGSLAARIGVPEIRARHLQEAHRRTYPRLYDWLEAAVDHAMVYGYLETVFGWKLHAGEGANPRSLQNFPCQANGAEMMRLACSAATEAGLAVCCPIHDALLVEADLADIDVATEALREIMEASSRAVLDGFTIRTDAEIVRAPHRYMDPRGAAMWQQVRQLLASEKSDARAG
ncbi:MAG: hypothetical protein AMXMBFR8_25930 [Nevskiales bacterium]